MSLRDTTFSHIKTETQTIPFELQQTPHYVICMGLAGLSGIIAVAMTIGMAVVYQLLFVQTEVWTPNFILLATGTAVVSCGVAWLVAQGSQLIIPPLARNFNEKSWQIIFIVSILASLIEFSLFMRGL